MLQIQYNNALKQQVEWYTNHFGDEESATNLDSMYKKGSVKKEEKPASNNQKGKVEPESFPKFKKYDLPKLPGENPFSVDKIQQWRDKIGPKKFEIIDKPKQS